MLHYCFKYRFALYGQFIVYLVSIFGLSINVKFLKGSKDFPFSREVNYVHYFFHWATLIALTHIVYGGSRRIT